MAIPEVSATIDKVKVWLAKRLYRWVLRLDHRAAGEAGAAGVIALLVHFHGNGHIVMPDRAFVQHDLELRVWRDAMEHSTHYKTQVRRRRLRFFDRPDSRTREDREEARREHLEAHG